jgi:LEA14-like dessication related protein
MKRFNSFSAVAAAALLALFSAACAGTKPPSLMIEGLKFNKLGLGGAGLNVDFRVRNTNAQDLQIVKFEYEFKVNGHRLGRGYYPDMVNLPGFGEQRIVSKFDVNFLALPGAVKNVLDKDRVKAEAKGAFYVRDGNGLRKLNFKSDGDVDLKK